MWVFFSVFLINLHLTVSFSNDVRNDLERKREREEDNISEKHRVECGCVYIVYLINLHLAVYLSNDVSNNRERKRERGRRRN
jgi:chemotaxis response regulator CheB